MFHVCARLRAAILGRRGQWLGVSFLKAPRTCRWTHNSFGNCLQRFVQDNPGQDPGQARLSCFDRPRPALTAYPANAIATLAWLLARRQPTRVLEIRL